MDFFSEVLVEDMWPLIFAEVFTLAPPLQVWSMSQVSKTWRAKLYRFIDCEFAALRKIAGDVDAACKMLYPRRMLALQREMAAFCLDLGMSPTEVLGYVRPAWFLEEQSGETLRRLTLLNMINARNRRHGLRGLPDYMLWHHGNRDCFRIYMGPLLFEEEPGWNNYLLALFLHCDRGNRGFQDCGLIAIEHFGNLWNVATNVNSPPWLLFFKGIYDAGTPLRSVMDLIDRRAMPLSKELCELLIDKFSGALFACCSTVHDFVRLAMSTEQQAYMASILPPQEPDGEAPITWYDVFPGLATLSPDSASGVYAFANLHITPHCPELFTPEIRKALVKAMQAR